MKYLLKNCITRKQRLKWKKKDKRFLKQIELFMKRQHNNAYFFERALLEALDNDVIAGAGLDVYEEEPTKNTTLVNHPKVSVTPHIGAATTEAQTRIGEEVVSIIKEFFKL